ncbi:hypothetical protein EW145_g2708 [Phellinidium pouzarii]|uniref:CAP-Gly domain-containing protein n=1 Tax=Phellinidium pouzarii TaxID=167371 RepID=A0A4S4LAA9_9AGAM|nr:hypothetical protein EW145_g2708 [Phellinidium pouzarii]
MATTPGRARSSGIPTPGRLRSFSSSASPRPPLPTDSEATERAFAEALKTNDPARHNSRSVSASSSTQRPSSVASSSRPKTPTASANKGTQRRPESRQSDLFQRVQREFIVGDNVRIESLGFEGTLRYLGEIAGKPGEWAGVELSGGFTGLGKNDGSVGDVRYFSCPEKCGVFVAYAKLSLPTVGPGSYSRPSSVASSRASMSGRITPSFAGRSSQNKGRVTPSNSNGRVTPAHNGGRATPSTGFGFSTPSARTAQRSTSHPTPSVPSTPSASALSKITAGSRASKYVGMTAQQLSASKPKISSYAMPASPSKINIGLGSPTRFLGPPSPSRSEAASPAGGNAKPDTRLTSFGTPKKSLGSGRQSLTTPRPRIPSAIAMPPPPSLPGSGYSVILNDRASTPAYSTTSNDTALDDDVMESLSMSSIQQNSRALKDKIQNLLSGKSSSTSRSHSPSEALKSDMFKDDSGVDANKFGASYRSLQERMENLERENAQMSADLQESRKRAVDADRVAVLKAEQDQAFSRIQGLESLLKTSERTLDERNTKIESLERTIKSSSDALESLRSEGDVRAKDLQTKIDDCETLISSLKDAIEAKSNEAGQNEGIIQAKDAEIGLLEARVKKTNSDLEDVRRDLAGQIDRLRSAGQETIALYEERLGSAESKRYELEDLVEQLEEQLKKLGSPSRLLSNDVQDSTEATRIDNEMLRDQIVHLQRKITDLEDLVEETRGSTEREEAAIRSRLQRHKDNEASMRIEVTEARAEAEEAGEALRENTLALENARAEIEGLRTEVAALESLQARNSTEKARTEESSRRAALERNRHNEEVSQLKDLLEVARTARKEALQELDAIRSDSFDASSSMSSLKQMVETLDSDKAELEHVRAELTAKLERERSTVAELRQALNEKSLKLESSRKALNRDRPVNVGLQDLTSSSTSSKHDSSSTRDEIKGLKHIVQELQKENSTIISKNKTLESENKMLLKETDSLRDELKLLEENVEQSLIYEENALASETEHDGSFNASAQKKPSDYKAKSDVETEQLRKQMADLEKKTARTIHDLNKEVNELESLIEAKIYREDELEREIERLKQKISKSSRPSKSSTEPPATEHRPAHSASNSTSTINGFSADANIPTASLSTSSGTETCEICEQPGHDIFTCPLLKDGPEANSSSMENARKSPKPETLDLFCEDCEGYGHLAANCPHSLDVF